MIKVEVEAPGMFELPGSEGTESIAVGDRAEAERVLETQLKQTDLTYAGTEPRQELADGSVKIGQWIHRIVDDAAPAPFKSEVCSLRL